MAQAICDRHTGIGADGWLLVSSPSSSPVGTHGSIRLYNSDGSDSEISGNGTRCAAAFLLDAGLEATHVQIATGAGTKHLYLQERNGRNFLFEMNMGSPVFEPSHLHHSLSVLGATLDTTILNVGNPQCVVFADELPENWRGLGRAIEYHPQFPNRTNVSFVKVIGKNDLEVFFWERGAGETMSSGTGSTGAAAAAVLRQLVSSPIHVRTPAGTLPIRWDSADIYLTGPAEIIAGGDFYLPANETTIAHTPGNHHGPGVAAGK